MKKLYTVLSVLLATMLFAAMVTSVSAQRTVRGTNFQSGRSGVFE